jgi:hypothetical protein
MATQQQAIDVHDDTKKFYKRDLKSDNKVYDPRASLIVAIGWGKAWDRMDRRESRLPQATALITNYKFSGQTPLQIGATLAGAIQGQRAGNCGEMACVAIYLASQRGVAPNDMWLVTATNRATKGAGWFFQSHHGLTMAFGHSWAEFGPPGNGFVVDPWANFWCPRAQYQATLTGKLKQWQQQGKKINVIWETESGEPVPRLMDANDPAILSLLLTTPHTIQSNQRIP